MCHYKDKKKNKNGTFEEKHLTLKTIFKSAI